MTVVVDLVIGIAGKVLSDVVIELVTGQKKAARMAEIEREVARQLEERSRFQKEQLALIRQQVLEEIANLVERDSGLKFSDDRIELKRRGGIPLFSPKPSTEEELKLQLDQLNMAVLARRQELHLLTSPVENAATSSKDNIQDLSVEWKQVSKKELDNPAAQEIKKLLDHIAERRSE